MQAKQLEKELLETRQEVGPLRRAVKEHEVTITTKDARIAELHKIYEVKLGNDSYSQQWCCGAIQALKELTKENHE